MAAKRKVLALGAGLAGALTLDGAMTQSPHVPELDGVPVRRELSRRLKLPVVVENDANAFVLGEWWKGAAKGAKVAAGLTLGTGVGGGLVLDGHVFRGAHGFAAEFGHIVTDVHGLPCRCGARGCLEAHVSGTALARIVADAAAAQSLDVEPTAKALFEHGRRGEDWANELLDDVANRLGVGLAGLVNALNPDIIVLGGSVARDFDVIRERTIGAMRRNAFREPGKRVRVKVGTLGRDAAMLGAARLAFDRMKQPRAATDRRRNR